MLTYYAVVMVLCLMTLGTLSVLAWENNRMPRGDKSLLYVTYALIAASITVECFGVWCGGRADLPAWLMPVAMCVDYMLKPVAGAALVAQMRPNNGWSRALVGLLACNVPLQVVAALKGWMVVVDGEGHYSHGVLYPAFLTASIAVVVVVTVEFVTYEKSYSRQNRRSLALVMSIVLAGIAMQALLPAQPKAVSVALVMGAALMYIRSVEFSSLGLDERLAAQRLQIDTDVLTGVLSRRAYVRALAELDVADALPEDLVVFVADVNGLKRVNDTVSHEAGDELIVGAARCLEAALCDHGQCFRTGGDEFVVMAHAGRDEVDELMGRLERETGAWHGRLVDGLTLSCGYAQVADFDVATAEALVHEADLVMYDAKAAYYQSAGHDRRRRRE